MSESRAAIVTGASRGIGLAIAQALVDRGVRVCVTGRNEAPLAEAVAQLGADRAMAVAGKAHDPAHQDAAIEQSCYPMTSSCGRQWADALPALPRGIEDFSV